MILCVKLINMCNSLIKITLNIETRVKLMVSSGILHIPDPSLGEI